MNNKEYFVDLSESELEEEVVILGYNKDNKLTIIIKNVDNIEFVNQTVTSNLSIRTNVLLNDKHYVHLIICERDSKKFEKHFQIIYQYLFSKIKEPIVAEEVLTLIDSLEEVFGEGNKLSKNQLIGLCGEYTMINYFLDLGIKDIYKNYHKNILSKFDFEFSNKIKMEVKTTKDNLRKHHFRHDQIKNENLNLYIASVILKENEMGMSLYELLNNVVEKTIDPELKFNTKTIILKTLLSEENKGLTFDYESTIDTIKFYDSNSVPRLELEIPEGVSNIQYEVTLTNIENLENFIDLIR